MSEEAIFETMRAGRGVVPLLDRHLARLRRSGEALGLPVPTDVELRQLVHAHVAAVEQARVRLVLDRGGPSVDVDPLPATAPVRLATVVAHPGPDEVHKLVARGRYAATQGRAQAAGADHALLVSSAGALLEADHANVIVVIDGALVTPPVRGVLPGLAREVLLEAGIVEERPLARAEIGAVPEIALVNALRGLIPVVSLDGRPTRPAAGLEAAAAYLRGVLEP